MFDEFIDLFHEEELELLIIIDENTLPLQLNVFSSTRLLIGHAVHLRLIELLLAILFIFKVS